MQRAMWGGRTRGGGGRQQAARGISNELRSHCFVSRDIFTPKSVPLSAALSSKLREVEMLTEWDRRAPVGEEPTDRTREDRADTGILSWGGLFGWGGGSSSLSEGRPRPELECAHAEGRLYRPNWTWAGAVDGGGTGGVDVSHDPVVPGAGQLVWVRHATLARKAAWGVVLPSAASPSSVRLFGWSGSAPAAIGTTPPTTANVSFVDASQRVVGAAAPAAGGKNANISTSQRERMGFPSNARVEVLHRRHPLTAEQDAHAWGRTYFPGFWMLFAPGSGVFYDLGKNTRVYGSLAQAVRDLLGRECGGRGQQGAGAGGTASSSAERSRHDTTTEDHDVGTGAQQQSDCVGEVAALQMEARRLGLTSLQFVGDVVLPDNDDVPGPRPHTTTCGNSVLEIMDLTSHDDGAACVTGIRSGLRAECACSCDPRLGTLNCGLGIHCSPRALTATEQLDTAVKIQSNRQRLGRRVRYAAPLSESGPEDSTTSSSISSSIVSAGHDVELDDPKTGSLEKSHLAWKNRHVLSVASFHAAGFERAKPEILGKKLADRLGATVDVIGVQHDIMLKNGSSLLRIPGYDVVARCRAQQEEQLDEERGQKRNAANTIHVRRGFGVTAVRNDVGEKAPGFTVSRHCPMRRCVALADLVFSDEAGEQEAIGNSSAGAGNPSSSSPSGAVAGGLLGSRVLRVATTELCGGEVKVDALHRSLKTEREFEVRAVAGLRPHIVLADTKGDRTKKAARLVLAASQYGPYEQDPGAYLDWAVEGSRTFANQGFVPLQEGRAR